MLCFVELTKYEPINLYLLFLQFSSKAILSLVMSGRSMWNCVCMSSFYAFEVFCFSVWTFEYIDNVLYAIALICLGWILCYPFFNLGCLHLVACVRSGDRSFYLFIILILLHVSILLRGSCDRVFLSVYYTIILLHVSVIRPSSSRKYIFP
jgi:hypothetical protein